GGGGVAQLPIQTTNRCRNTLGLDRVDHELAKICELPLPCLDPEMRLISVARGLDPDEAAWMEDTPEPRYDEDDNEMDEAEEEDYYNELDDYGETDDAASSTDRSGRGEDTGRGESAGRGEDDGCDGDSVRGEEDGRGDEEGLGE
ncbi:unnamed protein product, partial [Lymnaea stagnalis]